MFKYPFLLRSRQTKKGFSIIELIFTIVIIALILGIGGLVVSNILNSWHLVTTKKELLFNGRVALNRMVREIRHTLTFHKCEKESLEFDANIPYKATTVKIGYSTKADDDKALTLIRRENNGTNFDLAHHLKDLTFEYGVLDPNNEIIYYSKVTSDDLDRIRIVKIELEFEHPVFKTTLKLKSSVSKRQNN